MTQTETIKRIEEICKEFDARVIEVGLPIARLELAKTLTENEAESETLRAQVTRLEAECVTAAELISMQQPPIEMDYDETVCTVCQYRNGSHADTCHYVTVDNKYQLARAAREEQGR